MGVTAVNLGCGLIAGLAAAVVSQPADTLLSQINKEKARPGEGTGARLWRIGSSLGIRGAFTGMQARAVMVGGMTAVQFGIYGDIKKVCSRSSKTPIGQVCRADYSVIAIQGNRWCGVAPDSAQGAADDPCCGDQGG